MRGFKLGDINIDVPVGLAPMAGVSDMPMRKLCAENGAGLFVTEMISAKALHFKSKNTRTLSRYFLMLSAGHKSIVFHASMKNYALLTFVSSNCALYIPA